MRTSQFLSIFASLTFSISAYGASSTLEPINIISVVQSGDFMPPIAPDATPLTEITFVAVSSGCTDASSFEVLVAQTSDGQIVKINRIKRDLCKMLSHEAEITVKTYGLDRSFAVWDGSGQQSIENPVLVFNPQLVKDHTTH